MGIMVTDFTDTIILQAKRSQSSCSQQLFLAFVFKTINKTTQRIIQRVQYVLLYFIVTSLITLITCSKRISLASISCALISPSDQFSRQRLAKLIDFDLSAFIEEPIIFFADLAILTYHRPAKRCKVQPVPSSNCRPLSSESDAAVTC